MFWLIFLLLFAGIVLILLEVIVPHGISIIAGLLVIGASIYLAFKQPWAPGLAALYLAFAGLLAGGSAFIVFRSGVKLMALTPPSRESGMGTDGVEQASQPKIGDQVEVVQPLRPTGTILWRGRRFAARTTRLERESHPGETVKISGHDSIYLLVDPLELPSEES